MFKTIPHYIPGRAVIVQVSETTIIKIDPVYEKGRLLNMKPLLEKYAKVFFSKGQVFDKEYPVTIPGRCYDNAFNMSVATGLVYCEGLMVFDDKKFGLHMMPHAWCSTPTGRVYDPTCREVQHHDYVTYAGIPFDQTYTEEWVRKYGFAGMMDGHHTLGGGVGVYTDQPCKWLSVAYHSIPVTKEKE